jgi:urease accessory protein
VWLEVGADWLRYQHDHVLDDMVRNLGGEIRHECCGFEPEAGAYSSSAHAHAH